MKKEIKKLFEGKPSPFFDAVRAQLQEKVETVIPFIAEELAESVFIEGYKPTSSFIFSDKDYAQHKPLGAFTEKDHGHQFQYSGHDNEWAKKHGLQHRIKVGNSAGLHSDYRYGNVKGTRAHVAVDENDDGTPKMETWHFKKHYRYND
jgi:hypothetical protein